MLSSPLCQPSSPDATPAFDAFRLAIREVLLKDWDPHNAARMPDAAAGTYDGYVQPLANLLLGGAGEAQVVEWLHEREKESMCFPSLGTRRLVRIAQLLLGLRDPNLNS